MSDRLATTDMDRNFGAVPLWEGELGKYSVAGAEAYLRAKFHLVS